MSAKTNSKTGSFWIEGGRSGGTSSHGPLPGSEKKLIELGTAERLIRYPLLLQHSRRQELLVLVEPKTSTRPMNPKLFISYSWSSDDHQAWVLRLATQLRESGVDVIVDKWDLKEGQDAHAFMERMVTDAGIKKVALICDRVYAEKANGRVGGVGTEAQIITPEIYGKADQNKFVAVIAERDGNGQPCQPAYAASRINIDLSDAEAYGRNFDQLLRWIYDKPLHVKPELGRAPAFVENKPGPSLQTSGLFQRALDAVRNNRDHAEGTVVEYFDRFAENLEEFRISPDGQSGYDDHIVASIEQFLPFRNELVELTLALARYRAENLGATLHRFIERIASYQFRPENDTGWQEFHASNYDFIVHELFLYIVAALLKWTSHATQDTTGLPFEPRRKCHEQSTFCAGI